MLYVITKSEKGYRKWFYQNSVLEKWNEFMQFFKDKHVVEMFISDMLTPQDFLKIRYNQIKYMMEAK